MKLSHFFLIDEALIKDPTIVKLLKSFNTSVGQHYLNRDILEVYCDTSIDAAFTTSSSPLSLSIEQNNMPKSIAP